MGSQKSEPARYNGARWATPPRLADTPAARYVLQTQAVTIRQDALGGLGDMAKSGKSRSKSNKQTQAKESWAGCFKAIGVRALSAGKFWQFCFACVLLCVAWKIESPDWVKIAELFLSSRVYSGLGWILFVLAILCATVVHKLQARLYRSQIEYLTTARDGLRSSVSVANPAIPSPHQPRIESKVGGT